MFSQASVKNHQSDRCSEIRSLIKKALIIEGPDI